MPFSKIDLADVEKLKVFNSYKPTHVINLAAQAGVRYSLENPMPTLIVIYRIFKYFRKL